MHCNQTRRKSSHLPLLVAALSACFSCGGIDPNDPEQVFDAESNGEVSEVKAGINLAGISNPLASLGAAIDHIVDEVFGNPEFHRTPNNPNDDDSDYTGPREINIIGVPSLKPESIRTYTYDDYRRGRAPTLVGREPNNGAPFVGVLEDYRCCFYRNLPAILTAVIPADKSGDKLGGLILTNRVLRRPAASQRPLTRAIAELRAAPVATDPFVAYGLLGLRATLVQDAQQGSTVASPTHYDREENRLYVNEQDLAEYGLVVVLHEVLHVALYKAVKNKVITSTQYQNIVRLNQTHFANYDGYVGLSGGPKGGDATIALNLLQHRQLGMEKAFSIGYSMLILGRSMMSLSFFGSKTHPGAVKFSQDVYQNKRIATIRFIAQNATLQKPLHIIDSDASFDKTSRFLNQFLDKSTSTRSIIQPAFTAIRSELGARCGGKVCDREPGPVRVLLPNGPL